MTARLLFALSLMTALRLSAPAQSLEFAPGAQYDGRIPTLKQVAGHDFGQRVTTPEDIIRYLKALNGAAPDRTKLIKYAESWEGRELYAIIIADADLIRRLDEIKAGLQRLANPASLSQSDAERLIKESPVVVALVHGVHGNEISSGEAALAEAYHLLAAQTDATVDLIRRNCIVIIDPMQNPDGRARFVFQNLLGQASTPDPEPAAAEHDEPWPGGRSNHYLFDLNRDWFAQTQPESQGRVKLMLEWAPHVVVDLHEMGGDSTYYFPPSAEPPNPHLTRVQGGWLETFGQANAARFDERGFAYFNREVFDAFYPGYGVSWPMAQGAIGMTFEMASARGLAYRRQDETTLTYLDGAVRHFTSAIMTATTASRNREKMLRDYLEYRRNAGSGTTKAYLLPIGHDAGQTLRLVRTLINNGVTVRRAEEPIKLDSRTLPAGTFIAPLPQPAGMLLRNLVDPQAQMNAEFLRRQDERRKKRLPDQIYDTTAWNMPMLYDVECIGVDRELNVKSSAVDAASATPSVTGELSLPDAVVGYALPWNATSSAAAIEALQGGLRARFLSQPFTIAGRKFAKGAAIFRASDNGADLKSKLAAVAARHGAEVVKLDSAFVSEGTSLGSNQVVALRPPKVLLAWDAPTVSLSAGWARYVLERRYGQSVTAVRVNSLNRIDLRSYDVLILPSGSYAFNADSLRRIKDWVGAGGTLITVAEASRWAARETVGLLETRTEMRDGAPESEPITGPSGAVKSDKSESATRTSDFTRAIQPLREQPELTPGAILRVQLDEDHWLASGADGEIQALVESTRVFTPIKLDKGRNVGIYAMKNRILASGLMWDAAMDQLPQKAFLIHQPMGQGHIIAFAEDPNYRAYAEMTQFLFINAVLLGPAY
ncbi:MAG TPA: M14 family metallopeptidase [Blastocatellia bacterium]|nr:M14 family metallopeptidase [Blastocatellia bacterium]